MKKILSLIALAFCTAQLSQAQIQIGGASTPTMNRAGDLDEEDLAAFKQMTTVFYVQEKDVDRREDFEKALKSVWTINPFVVALPDEMDKYSDGHKYASFSFGGFIVQKSSGSGASSTYAHLSYDLGIVKYKKDEAKGRTLLARFMLTPDQQTLAASMRTINTFGRRKQEDKFAQMLYTSAVFANWGPGFIKAYAKFINDGLLTKTRRGIFSGIVDKAELPKLATETLYLPNSLKNRFNMFTGQEKMDEDNGDEEELAKAYPYKVVYISDDELQQKIVDATKPFYYVQYIRSSTDKYVNVIEAKSGSIVYADYTPASYNFKMKDLKKIAKEIK